MRPTLVHLSDMPGPKVYNLWWGDKSGMKQKGMVSYTLSPFQSRAAPKMISSYLFNGTRRLAGQAAYFVIPFALGYAIYDWAKKTEAWQNSKAGHIASGHH